MIMITFRQESSGQICISNRFILQQNVPLFTLQEVIQKM